MAGAGSGKAALVAAVVVVLAGCLGAVPSQDDEAPAAGCTPGPSTPRPEADLGALVEDGPTHDHGDPGQHTERHAIDPVGFTPMTSAMAEGGLPGGYVDFELAGDWAFVSNWGPHRGLSIVDIADPADPRHVADVTTTDLGSADSAAAGSYWDLAVFPDADLVVLAAQALAGTGLGDRADQQGGGLYLVDVTDKSDPAVESFTRIVDGDATVPTGVHNVRAFELDGNRYAVATTANGGNQLFRVVGEPGDRDLSLVSTFAGMHDTSFQVHPVTGTPLIYTANNGVLIWDVSDPANPTEVAFVPNGENLSAYHQVNPSNVLIDGRHVVVAATEDAEGRPMPYTFLDTTDPTSPEILGQWRLPADLEGPHEPYQFTSHNVDLDRGRLYAGHYHAGVWVVDVSNLTNARDPFAVGMVQPHEDAPNVPRTALGRNAPAVWSANRYDGHVYAVDVNSGLYVLDPTVPTSPLSCATVHPSNIP